MPLSMKGDTIFDSPHVKILGVAMDQRLKYDNHAARVAKRGLRAVMALKRLRGLRPSTSRQLFDSIVTPTVDYASPIWSLGATAKLVKMAEEVQAIAAKKRNIRVQNYRSTHRRSGSRHRHSPRTVELTGTAILGQLTHTPTLTPFLELEEEAPTVLQTLQITTEPPR